MAHSPTLCAVAWQLDQDYEGTETMEKCDKCDNMARITVSGAVLPAQLCAWHCAQLCREHGDMVGYEKFIRLSEGDKVTA